MMTIRQAVSWGSDKLKSHGVENAEHDSFELLSAVNGMTRTFYLVNGDSFLSEEDFLLFEEYIDKRAAHIPLQHIIGKAYFYGYEFEVNGDVLVPRQDTEILVGEVMKVARSGDYILDMCTGSGCIGITIAKKFPEVKVLGIDVSEKALAVAEKNKHNLEADNIDFMLSDLFEKLNQDITFDIIVSNPPYIPTKVIDGLQDEVRLHDPILALDGSEDGLKYYRNISSEAGKYLEPDGWLCFEIGAEQALDVSDIMEREGFRNITVIKDLAGLDRVVMGRK
ncbi:MAG: peptide chain release factor N(5)-glutamine methyltransferase [Lachnospira sp.]|nr:peptide chain release factor N(5)-glutamine methyltransferase [Lachnospira sp.]